MMTMANMQPVSVALAVLRAKRCWAGCLGVSVIWVVANIATVALAGDLVARRALATGTIISPADLAFRSGPAGQTQPKGEASARALSRVAGLRLQRAVAPGDVVRPSDLALPFAVTRNDRVSLGLERGGLAISTTGKALEDGTIGARIPVLNLASGTVVDATVTGRGMTAVVP